jgi:hypothetical protein
MDLTSVLTLISVGTSIVATGVTAWMAIETRRMASAARRSVELEHAAIVGVRDVRVEVLASGRNETGASPRAPTGISGIRIGVELFNAGRVPAKYEMKSMSVSLAERTAASAQFLSRGGRILPGSSTVFWHPMMHLDPPVTTFPATGRVRVNFEYAGESVTEPQSIVAIVEYVVGGAAPGSPISWLYVDEPAALAGAEATGDRTRLRD